MKTMDLGTGLYTKEDFERLLAHEVAEADADGRAYAVVAVVPQRLPGEGVADVVRAATSCVRDLVRDEDIAGRLDDEVLAVGLYNGDAIVARVFAHRLQGDLRLRSFHLRNTLWETGYAVLPDDGNTANALLRAAIEAARSRRRRMAEEPRHDAVTIPPALGDFGPR